MSKFEYLPDSYYDWFPKPTDEQIAAGNMCGACHRCLDATQAPMEKMTRMMILCPGCGNKRCPAASDCTRSCTESNEPGQEGSVYK